ncbi:uncharacterized protein LOC105830502 [Monomorium pharaonis]|uniref:uncharacterized protein LOC105830502 n=1 Tax=Monomorium pharaonis TaxID=307658 RepID=UPI001747804B|nr:uncharacterized protein LOC105830502 [Monomorium pharaonis]
MPIDKKDILTEAEVNQDGKVSSSSSSFSVLWRIDSTLLKTFLLVTCIKILLIPTYHSTDFEVHRNWLAITHSLPVTEWYINAQSSWTLDYPPLFAWFEYCLSQVAALFDPEMLKVENLNYASPATVYFQRGTVIFTDLIFAFGVQEMSRTFCKSLNSHVVFIFLSLCNVGLLIVDHIHFQYNGFLLGVLLMSMANVSKTEEQMSVLLGATWFAILLNLKHLYVYVAPAYIVWLLKSYCLNSGNFLKRLFSLGLVVLTILAVSFGPFRVQLPQVISRLFPFKRGLVHSYWAANGWALYIGTEKVLSVIWKRLGWLRDVKSAVMTGGLVQEQNFLILPTPTPIITFLLTFAAMFPALWYLLCKRSHNSKDFVRCIVLCALSSFMFGWHVHEKAILTAIVPLCVLAAIYAEDARIFIILSSAGQTALLPLLYPDNLSLLKLLLSLTYILLSILVLTNQHGRHLLRLHEWLYVISLPLVTIYEVMLHKLLLGDKLPFLPLAFTSIYCAIGVTYCWILYYYTYLQNDTVICVNDGTTEGKLNHQNLKAKSQLPFQMLSASKSPSSSDNVSNKKKRKIVSPSIESKKSKVIKLATKENLVRSTPEKEKEDTTERKLNSSNESVEIISDEKKDLEQSDQQKIRKSLDSTPKRKSVGKNKKLDRSQQKPGALTKFLKKTDREIEESDIRHDNNLSELKIKDCQDISVHKKENEIFESEIDKSSDGQFIQSELQNKQDKHVNEIDDCVANKDAADCSLPESDCDITILSSDNEASKEEKANRRREREEKQKEKEEKERIEKEQKRKEKELKELRKQMEIEQKQKEKEAKEEERKKREEEKRKKEEERLEAERKKQKAASNFASFFVPKKQEVKSADGENIEVKNFMPFEIKADMRVAPICRRKLNEHDKLLLDDMCNIDLDKTELYLENIKRGRIMPRTSCKTWPLEAKDDDVILLDEDNDGSSNIITNTHNLEKHRPKLLQFSENRRPPYWGTWQKRSSILNPRRPFTKDKKWFDYEVDSDDEWEEEEPGESLKGSDDEKDEENPEENEYDVDNEFMVPHGYLSDEEAQADEEEMEDMSPQTQKMKLKILGEQFEAERNAKTYRLKPKIIGCIWQGSDNSFPESVPPKVKEFLLARQAWVNNIPIIFPSTLREENSSVNADCKTPTHQQSVRGAKKTKFPDEALPDLIRLVHGNRYGRHGLMREFMTFWSKKSGSQLSKVSILSKINEIADRIACPEEGPMHLKSCWYVPKDIRKQYFPDVELSLPNCWEYILTPKSRKIDTENIVVDKTMEKEKEEKDKEKEKKHISLITQFTKKITQEEMQKQLAKSDQEEMKKKSIATPDLKEMKKQLTAKSDQEETKKQMATKPDQEETKKQLASKSKVSVLPKLPPLQRPPKRATLISVGRGEQFPESSRQNMLAKFVGLDKKKKEQPLSNKTKVDSDEVIFVESNDE